VLREDSENELPHPDDGVVVVSIVEVSEPAL
jgi:hypothetical protein